MRISSLRRAISGLIAVILVSSLGDGRIADASERPPEAHGAAEDWEPGPAKFGIIVADNVAVKMDDDVVLKAIVQFPADLATGARSPGPFPVIVNITPYAPDIEPYVREHGKLFTQHGYIFASVSIRGTQRSEGVFGFLSERDAADGARIVEWAARELDGSNGTVGGYGCSYPGMTMIATAGKVGKGSPLKAIIPACTGWDQVREMSFVGGIPTGDSVLFDLMPEFVGNQPSAKDIFGNIAEDVRSGGPAAYSGFWESRQPISYAKSIVENDIPTLLWTGWNDVNRRGALEMYAAMQNAAKGSVSTDGPFRSKTASGKYQVIIGPWKHTEGLDPRVMLKWYDTWLKGEGTGIDDTMQPLHLYDQASKGWVNATSYPLDSDYDTFYLDRNSALTPRPGNGSGEQTIAWQSPADPDGKLEYTTAPFTNGATLAGPSSVEVFAASSTTNLALIATLLDVAPNGSELPITFGVVLGSQRALDPHNTWRDSRGTLVRPFTTQSRDVYLKPGEQQKFSIALHPTLWSIKPGHAVRMRFTTQPAQQDCEVDGGIGVLLPCLPNDLQRASLAGSIYQITWSPDAPSAVHLPLLAYRCFKSASPLSTPNGSSVGAAAEWQSSGNHCDSSGAEGGGAPAKIVDRQN